VEADAEVKKPLKKKLVEGKLLRDRLSAFKKEKLGQDSSGDTKKDGENPKDEKETNNARKLLGYTFWGVGGFLAFQFFMEEKIARNLESTMTYLELTQLVTEDKIESVTIRHVNINGQQVYIADVFAKGGTVDPNAAYQGIDFTITAPLTGANAARLAGSILVSKPNEFLFNLENSQRKLEKPESKFIKVDFKWNRDYTDYL
jgi:hypothetical protein